MPPSGDRHRGGGGLPKAGPEVQDRSGESARGHDDRIRGGGAGRGSGDRDRDGHEDRDRNGHGNRGRDGHGERDHGSRHDRDGHDGHGGHGHDRWRRAHGHHPPHWPRHYFGFHWPTYRRYAYARSRAYYCSHHDLYTPDFHSFRDHMLAIHDIVWELVVPELVYLPAKHLYIYRTDPY